MSDPITTNLFGDPVIEPQTGRQLRLDLVDEPGAARLATDRGFERDTDAGQMSVCIPVPTCCSCGRPVESCRCEM